MTYVVPAVVLPKTPAQAVAHALNEVRYPDENYNHMCDHFVAYMYGLSASGYYSAIAHWNAIPSRFRHSGTPPVGGLPFWSIGTYGHVALMVNATQIASNDIITAGRISVVSLGTISAQWGARYLGWAQPYYAGRPLYVPPVTPVDLSSLVNATRYPTKAIYPYGVRKVQAALRAEGINVPYTGYWNGTRTGYATWQKRCGYTGTAADGVPGLTSLRRLGSRHGWTVVA